MTSLQSRNNFGKRELSIFLMKIMAAILILMTAQGWGEKEICTQGAFGD